MLFLFLLRAGRKMRRRRTHRKRLGHRKVDRAPSSPSLHHLLLTQIPALIISLVLHILPPLRRTRLNFSSLLKVLNQRNRRRPSRFRLPLYLSQMSQRPLQFTLWSINVRPPIQRTSLPLFFFFFFLLLPRNLLPPLPLSLNRQRSTRTKPIPSRRMGSLRLSLPFSSWCSSKSGSRTTFSRIA